MTLSEYSENLTKAYLLVKMAADLPIDEMLAMCARAETVVPMLDPTLWIQKHKAMEQDVEVLRALRPAMKLWRDTNPTDRQEGANDDR